MLKNIKNTENKVSLFLLVVIDNDVEMIKKALLDYDRHHINFNINGGYNKSSPLE